jgi:hypothetical protein
MLEPFRRFMASKWGWKRPMMIAGKRPLPKVSLMAQNHRPTPSSSEMYERILFQSVRAMKYP